MNVNGWTLKIYPAFGEINEFIFKRIPEDPSAPEFRQGKTLGTDKKHWFRAKFNRRFRLFFRYSSTEKVIIYSWINDEYSLRKEGAKTDPYNIFTKMLASGNPPDSWNDLLKASDDLECVSEDFDNG
jgi:toxin YhaV